jgi:hypothetical protein
MSAMMSALTSCRASRGDLRGGSVALVLINSAARCAWAAAVNTARLSAASTFSQVAI